MSEGPFNENLREAKRKVLLYEAANVAGGQPLAFSCLRHRTLNDEFMEFAAEIPRLWVEDELGDGVNGLATQLETGLYGSFRTLGRIRPLFW